VSLLPNVLIHNDVWILQAMEPYMKVSMIYAKCTKGAYKSTDFYALRVTGQTSVPKFLYGNPMDDTDAQKSLTRQMTHIQNSFLIPHVKPTRQGTCVLSDFNERTPLAHHTGIPANRMQCPSINSEFNK